MFDNYGVTSGDERPGYAVDHLVPVSLGGTADRSNLWPMPMDGSMGFATKAQVAELLSRAVCRGEIELAAAQRAMVADWPIAHSSTAPFPPAPPSIAVPVPGPPVSRPPDLTSAQQEQVRAVVRADPFLGHLLEQGQMRPAVGGSYGEGRAELLGGVVRIVFDPPAAVDFQVPLAGCIDGRKRRVLQRVQAEHVQGIAVIVHFADGGRVERALVEPSPGRGPQATVRTTTLRDLVRPGERCRNPPSGD